MPDRLTVRDASNRDRISLSAWGVMVRELVECRELILRLVRRNIAGQFRQSFLGYVWIILPPVAVTLIFSILRQAQIVNVPMDDHDMPYALFALTGTTIWGAFTSATLMATTSIATSGNLVSKIYFPRETLVVSAVGGAVVNTLIQLVVLALAFLVAGYAPDVRIVFGVFVFIPLYLYALGFGMIFAPINTMMNDMSRILQFLFQFGMFLAPTVYPTPNLETSSSAWQVGLYIFHKLNPISHIIYAVHDLIESGTLPAGPGFPAAMAGSLLVFALGWRFFHVTEPLLAERI